MKLFVLTIALLSVGYIQAAGQEAQTAQYCTAKEVKGTEGKRKILLFFLFFRRLSLCLCRVYCRVYCRSSLLLMHWSFLFSIRSISYPSLKAWNVLLSL